MLRTLGNMQGASIKNLRMSLHVQLVKLFIGSYGVEVNGKAIFCIEFLVAVSIDLKGRE